MSVVFQWTTWLETAYAFGGERLRWRFSGMELSLIRE